MCGRISKQSAIDTYSVRLIIFLLILEADTTHYMQQILPAGLEAVATMLHAL